MYGHYDDHMAEASHADYRAVLAAVNALGANQREHALGLAGVQTDLATVKADVGAVKTDVAELKTEMRAVKTDMAALKTDVAALKIEFVDFRQESRATFRSVDEQFAEVKDLIISLRDRDQA